MASSADSAEPSVERRDLHIRAELIAPIVTEFRGMAGLTLTKPQACRLFHLPLDHCERILQELADGGLLAIDYESHEYLRPAPCGAG
jgi:hypothetical protein